MLEWAVIADDLTGAADTGVQFLPVCAPVFLVDYRKLEAPALRAAAPAGLTVFTNSRALPSIFVRSHVVSAPWRAARSRSSDRISSSPSVARTRAPVRRSMDAMIAGAPVRQRLISARLHRTRRGARAIWH